MFTLVRNGLSVNGVPRAAMLTLMLTALPRSVAPALKNVSRSAAIATGRVASSFSSPPILRNMSSLPRTVEVTITAAPARLELLPGKLTDVYAYNGSIPGPTLEAREGDHVIIHFYNNLPEPSTIHCHGIHLPADMDGSPFGAVPPGSHFDYSFTIKAGTAGTYWYHPHPDLRSEYQVAKGLFGAIIVRADDDPIASIPEKLLILSDNRFLSDGSIDFPDSTSVKAEVDEENGREGNVLFVNGKVMPALSIRSGEVQRWRVINASASAVYRLAIPGQTMLHVGSDGGLFGHPVEVHDILVASSERVELLVRGTGPPGSQAQLQALPYDRYMPQTRPADWNVPHALLSLNVSSATPMVPVPIPAVLRVVPALDTNDATATHLIVLSQGLINGKMMDMHRVDVHGKLGATEIWQLENVVGMDHPFHLHGFQFQVIDRNGVPEPYRSWKDVVNIPKHESVRLIVKYSDFPGKWMFHCHILAHEDHGMMAVLEVK
ncbi:MAG: multicopper oxidase family protein [Gemmatimonadaceae bacterium]